jgi:hypothetical protein
MVTGKAQRQMAHVINDFIDTGFRGLTEFLPEAGLLMSDIH